MPRGRHRHSPPLHRLLAPLTVAGAASALAVGAWFSPTGGQAIILRVLCAAAAATACTGAVLLRAWDRAAGKRVADLAAERARDEWRAEERAAELETGIEEAREIRRGLEAALRARHGELSRLRGEHAELLHRYATAEAERANVLESHRRLVLEAATARRAVEAAPSSGRAEVSPAAYRRAAEALLNLGRGTGATPPEPPEPPERPKSAEPAEPAESPEPAERRELPARRELPELPVRRQPQLAPAAVPRAVPVLPYGSGPAPRPQGSFDFFGLGGRATTPAADALDDLADVVGPEVIDLTAHDATEPIDVRALRAEA